MANNPVDLITTVANAILPANPQIGPGGEVYGEWWESASTVMAGSTPTIIGAIQLQGQNGRMAIEVKNAAGTTWTAFKIQGLATPNADFIDYITSAQLNTGTPISGILLGQTGNPTTLTNGSSALVIIDTNALWAIQFIATATAGGNGKIFASSRRFG